MMINPIVNQAIKNTILNDSRVIDATSSITLPVKPIETEPIIVWFPLL